MAKNILAFSMLIFVIAACGGSDGEKQTSRQPPAGPAAQSPGGIWHVIGGPGESVTMLIAETGELDVIDVGPAFGAGAVIVNDGDQLVGSYDTRSVQTSPTPTTSGLDPSCDIEGTLVERVAIKAMLRCVDSDGGETTRTVGMAYDALYEPGSTLAEIAGNYTLSFRSQTNVLNINSDGVIFGMLDNGASCTVNGKVEIIDPRFNLYRFELLLSSCHVRPSLEGQTFRGLAFRNAPGLADGAFLLLATGTVDGRLEFFSLGYEPT